ncbi:polyhydroxyalkanoic acid system family protein [Psychrobacter sp. FDAARGOS_221]|uniref:polyhydroxyalkanoic acid system family protein n=1 Tax=Psychrobacter sp. FDAARGOS_221 TaxID=1975705 RepID=UPI001D0D37A2|nr:polyhydroxyalkanoic acid system family protein [Psychrobacter sp. FDAARGOS_221]
MHSACLARQVTDEWIESAEKDYRMTCSLERLDTKDIVTFKRTGATGQFVSTPDKFELDAKLGFLFKSFLPKIKEQIEQNLDKVIDAKGLE